jgi:predicted N-acetyltransferase YhbS
MYDITPERPDDLAQIEALLDAAFEPGRHARPSYALRRDQTPDPHLCLVARAADGPSAGRIIGSVRYWPVQIGRHAALLLGPLAVAPDRQGEGIGAALIYASLDMAAWARHRRVVLVGDPAYYRRFGFVPAAPLGILVPGAAPERVQVLALDRHGLENVKGSVAPRRLVRGRLMAA